MVIHRLLMFSLGDWYVACVRSLQLLVTGKDGRVCSMCQEPTTVSYRQRWKDIFRDCSKVPYNGYIISYGYYIL